MRISSTSSLLVALLATAAVAAAPVNAPPSAAATVIGARALWIAQARSASDARRSVIRVQRRIERELAIIHGGSAYLNPGQVEQLRADPGVHLFADRSVTTRTSLLSALTTTTTAVTSSPNSALAPSPLPATASSIVTPVVAAVVKTPVASAIT